MAVVYKVDHFSSNAHWVYKTYYLFLVHKITLFTVGIEPTKAVIFFLVNIKPTRSCETSKNITVHFTAW